MQQRGHKETLEEASGLGIGQGGAVALPVS
jgi:hypothetical protein